ncbi:hypothetical protein [Streptomyces sp. NPDC058694]|uniref:hypothetical protein n=1 Tax=Streptomyces sp. NPDC058694 TaxID=3346603 RepID=UPI00364E3625
MRRLPWRVVLQGRSVRHPSRRHPPSPPLSRPRASHFPDRRHALQRLDSERANLTAAAIAAPAFGHRGITLDLASDLAEYLNFRRYFDDWIALAASALAVCRELDDRRGEGRELNILGIALREVRRFDEAFDAHTTAAVVCREVGDRRIKAKALGAWAIVHNERWL